MEDWAGRRIWRTGRGEGYGGLGGEKDMEDWAVSRKSGGTTTRVKRRAKAAIFNDG